jgi:hypothetical protein
MDEILHGISTPPKHRHLISKTLLIAAMTASVLGLTSASRPPLNHRRESPKFPGSPMARVGRSLLTSNPRARLATSTAASAATADSDAGNADSALEKRADHASADQTIDQL